MVPAAKNQWGYFLFSIGRPETPKYTLEWNPRPHLVSFQIKSVGPVERVKTHPSAGVGAGCPSFVLNLSTVADRFEYVSYLVLVRYIYNIYIHAHGRGGRLLPARKPSEAIARSHSDQSTTGLVFVFVFLMRGRVFNPLSTSVPFRGQTTCNLTGLSPDRDSSLSKRINPFGAILFVFVNGCFDTDERCREAALSPLLTRQSLLPWVRALTDTKPPGLGVKHSALALLLTAHTLCGWTCLLTSSIQIGVRVTMVE